RFSTTSDVDGDNSQTDCGELAGNPIVVPAVRVETRDDGHDAACGSLRLPGVQRDPQTACALERSFMWSLRNSLSHRVLLFSPTLRTSFVEHFALPFDPLPHVGWAVRQALHRRLRSAPATAHRHDRGPGTFEFHDAP